MHEAELEGLRERQVNESDGFAVWPENWRAVEVFTQMASQWRLVVGTGSAHWQGMRYEALEAVLRITGVPRREWPTVFGAVRVMEAAARGELNK